MTQISKISPFGSQPLNTIMRSLLSERASNVPAAPILQALTSEQPNAYAVLQLSPHEYGSRSYALNQYAMRAAAEEGDLNGTGLSMPISNMLADGDSYRKHSSIANSPIFGSFHIGKNEKSVFLYVGAFNYSAVPYIVQELKVNSDSIIHRHDIRHIRSAHANRLKNVLTADRLFAEIQQSIAASLERVLSSKAITISDGRVSPGIAGVTLGRYITFTVKGADVSKLDPIATALALILQNTTVDKIHDMIDGYLDGLNIIEPQ